MPTPRTGRRATPVHPRARGEHVDEFNRSDLHVGSSPRSRGTSIDILRTWFNHRFIPALAGNIRFVRESQSMNPVHPRARGEHKHCSVGCSIHYGSSPRSRGTSGDDGQVWEVIRFIPALAGNMIQLAEKVSNNFGSSPRSRGTYRFSGRAREASRFIPALAGNIACTYDMPICRAVHPRARGEHDPSFGGEVVAVGSSPRSRGTCGRSRSPAPRRRFIPALAGNIVRRSICGLLIPVHPRARGEH